LAASVTSPYATIGATTRTARNGHQRLHALVARPLHETDHGRRREHAPAADVHGEELLVDDALEAVLEPRLNADFSRHQIDCQR